MSREAHAGFCERRGVRLPPATHLVVGFQHRDDAERFWADLRERFAQFNLELNEDKTRLIEFGRFAARDREAQGLRKPRRSTFLGFTHICAKDRQRTVQAQAGHEQEADAGEAAARSRPSCGDACTCPSPNRANGSGG